MIFQKGRLHGPGGLSFMAKQNMWLGTITYWGLGGKAKLTPDEQLMCPEWTFKPTE